MYAFELALPYLLHLASNAGAAMMIAAILGVGFWIGDHLFLGLIPKDFKQVPIVRRAAFIGGACFAFSTLWNAAFHAGGIEFSFLAPFGDRAPDFGLFWEKLMQTLSWLSPLAVSSGYLPSKLTYATGCVATLASLVAAWFYWRGAYALRAALVGLFVAASTALAIVYVAVAVVWLLQLMNIWFIALAGVLYQKYRNLQLAHGH